MSYYPQHPPLPPGARHEQRLERLHVDADGRFHLRGPIDGLRRRYRLPVPPERPLFSAIAQIDNLCPDHPVIHREREGGFDCLGIAAPDPEESPAPEGTGC